MSENYKDLWTTIYEEDLDYGTPGVSGCIPSSSDIDKKGERVMGTYKVTIKDCTTYCRSGDAVFVEDNVMEFENLQTALSHFLYSLDNYSEHKVTFTFKPLKEKKYKVSKKKK